jgi:hypothetical protein
MTTHVNLDLKKPVLNLIISDENSENFKSERFNVFCFPFLSCDDRTQLPNDVLTYFSTIRYSNPRQPIKCYNQNNYFYMQKNWTKKNWERVSTTKIRTSKVKNENIESQKFVKGSEHPKSPLKWSERRKIRTTTTTYGVVPMDTKACGGLG